MRRKLNYSLFPFLLVFFLTLTFCSKSRIGLRQEVPQKQPRFIKEKIFDLKRIYTQITTHPDLDVYPAISPDGNWIAFASKRNGNMEIWVKSVAGGTAYQITRHQADDIMPAWSPDGEKLAFVSFRNDALGDIWIISLQKSKGEFKAKGAPKQITNYLGVDAYPCFSPDGEYLAFYSNRKGVNNIFIYQVARDKIYQITNKNAMTPAWSLQGNRIAYISFNDSTSKGQLYCLTLDFQNGVPQVVSDIPVTAGLTDVAFPCWNPTGQEILFTRYDQDTDNDGKITPDDRPTLWKVKINASESFSGRVNSDNEKTLPTQEGEKNQVAFHEIKLLPNFYYDYQPVCSVDSIVYFISRRGHNEDIWSLPIEGPIARQSSAFLQYQFAITYFTLPVHDLIFGSDSVETDQVHLKNRIFAFSRVLDFFPNENVWSGWSLLEIAKTYKALNQHKIAKAYFDEVNSLYYRDDELIKRTHIALFKLKFEKEKDRVNEYIDSLDELIDNSPNFPDIQSEAQLLKAEVYFIHQKYNQALNELEILIANHPEYKERSAKAQVLIGDTYAVFGQKEEVVNAYLNVIRRYPDQERWVKMAMERILKIERKQNLESTIASYRNIIAHFQEYQQLAAWTQYKLGELFFQSEDYDAAIDELTAVIRNYSSQKEVAALAELKLADVFHFREDDLRSIRHYKNVMLDYGQVKSGEYSITAQERLIETYIRIASRYQRAGEISAARFHFRNAIELDPRNIEAHRGFIACLYSLNKIDEAINTYLKLKNSQPDDEIVLYMLGLCYSYKATEKSERTKNLLDLNLNLMKKSNAIIETALSKNYRIIQAYLTLSFNYEIIEQHQNALRNRRHGFVANVFNTITAPLETFFNWVTMKKEARPEQWYEKAIDVLTTAIALNDEKVNPLLESELALNLASNYYNLKEFGFERAYFYYQTKLKYDSTFASVQAEAEIYKRMGRCALVVEDFVNGPKYFRKAINLYNQLGDNENRVFSIKWLALLYQLAGEYDQSIIYFQKAAEYDKKEKRYNELEIDYRSIAYNFFLLNDHEEAIRSSEKALDLINEGKIKKVEAEPNWIKIGILGIEFPVWNLGEIGTGGSTAASGFTTQEEIALLYSIIGQSVFKERSINKAISYLKKKIEIYKKRNDKIAEAIFLNNIGYLHYLDFRYSNAWAFFERSFKICEKEDNTPGMLINTINLGSIGVIDAKFKALQDENSLENFNSHLNNDMQNYREQSIQRLHNALSFYENGLLGFEHEKVQIYNLLGSLHALSNGSNVDDSLKKSEKKAALIKDHFEKLEVWAIADSCYNVALSLSLKNKFHFEQIACQRNLAYLSYNLGELGDAIDRLTSARSAALLNNYSSILWRIDFDLGVILDQVNSETATKKTRRDAKFYFDEAINRLERNAEQLKTFRVTPFHRYKVRKLYETAVNYFVNQKRTLTALRLTEKYRGKEYLDTIGSHKLSLKKERHKIFLGNARFLKNEIALLEDKIREAELKDNQNEADILTWVKQKKKYEDEYQDLLEDLKDEDPELEAFITTEPITYPKIQDVLYDSVVVVDYFLTPKRLLIWTITQDSVGFYQMAIEKDVLFENIDEWLNLLSSNAEAMIQQKDNWIWGTLIEPIAKKIQKFNTVIIIPDDDLAKIPFSYLINFSSPNEGDNLKKVTTVPSLSNYYYSYSRRRIRGKKMLLGSSELKSKNYDFEYVGMDENSEPGETIQPKEKSYAPLTDADVLFLKVKYDQINYDPLMSSVQFFGFDNVNALRIRDVYGVELSSHLVMMDGTANLNTYAGLALKRAFLYAGCPTMIVSTREQTNDEFWKVIFSELQYLPVAEAFKETQLKMRQRGHPPADYAFYQIIGFQGMTNEQEEIYANERLFSTVAIANKYYDENDWDDALKNYESALKMAKKQDNLDAIQNLYELILDCAANGRLYDKAIYYQTELIARAEKNNDVASLAQGLNYLVYFYTQKGDFKNALKYQSEYLNLVKAYQLTDEVANSYRHLGLVHERDGNNEKALEYFTKALDVYLEIGDSLGIAESLKDRGRIYLLKFDKYSEALDDQEKSLKIFEDHAKKDKVVELLQNIGLSHERLANYQTALKYQERALELAQNLNAVNWIALSNQYLANVNWKIGNFEIALQHQREALLIFDQLQNKKLLSVGFATQGLIELSLGKPDKALELEKKALGLAEDLNDYQDMATIHKNISLIYRSKNDWQNALSQVEQALEYDRKIKSKRGQAYDYRDFGIIKFQLGERQAGLKYLHQALSLSQEIYDGRNIAQCFYEIGKVHFAQKNINAAIDTLTLAAEIAEKLFVPDVQWRAHRIMGQIYDEMKEFEKALYSFKNALDVVEEMRSQIKVEEYKSGFIDNKLDVYYDLVDLYLKLDDPARALQIVERAKSRNFIEMLANKEIEFSGDYDKQRLKQRKEIQEEMSRLQNEISMLIVREDEITADEATKLIQLKQQLSALKEDYKELLARLKEENPELAQMVNVELMEVSELQQSIPDSLLVLEYFYTKDKLIIWGVTKQNVFAKKRVIQGDELFSVVDSLRSMIENQLSIDKISRTSYDILIKPVEPLLEDVEHIVIIPHGVLHYMPFATLMDDDRKFLIEKQSLSLAPSAMVLKICLEKGNNFLRRNNFEPNILAFGNPDLGESKFELPFAEKEIESIELLFSDVKAFLEENATETNFKDFSSNRDMILLSCHGEFEAVNPLFSALLLSPDSENNGRLEAHEIFSLRLNSYLVAMSACETGLSKIGVGDELIGLNRSFIYAGATSLLSSLWKVDDLTTAIMIKRFFRYLKAGSTRAEALQKAVIFVKDNINVHPFYWSAFNITGDFR